jgi:biotin carboxylase
VSTPSLVLLASKLGYQTRAFAQAARRLGLAVVIGSDRCHQLDDPWSDGAVPLHFEEPEAAAQQVAEAVRGREVRGILALGDRPTEAAAYAAQLLGLRYNSPQSVEACRSKLSQRQVLRAAGLPVPDFFSFRVSDTLESVLARVTFPCVVKPLRLSASQGVIRVNDDAEFRAAVSRIAKLLTSGEIRATREPEMDVVLAESYIPGVEVAVEGLLDDGELRTLALFDKPDPLEGPYFEETIYTTPSRLLPRIQRRILDCAQQAICALGLTHGPVHAELRVNELGPWVLEVAPRPIGGLCSRVLRFEPGSIFLEELLVRHAVGLPVAGVQRESAAAGVMMIPVPSSGVLEDVTGKDRAKSVPGVEELHITARLHDFIAAWPEGSSYLGFIFARGETPQEVETALRQAHEALDFRIVPPLPIAPPV